jgi:hypothetical protein
MHMVFLKPASRQQTAEGWNDKAVDLDDQEKYD